MHKLSWIVAFAATVPSGLAQAQSYNLTPTDGGSVWQAKCTVIAVDAPPVGPCNGVYGNSVRISSTPDGWAAVPLVGPGGSAYYINLAASGSIWYGSPNENPHYEYTYLTTFDLLDISPANAVLFLSVFRFDNYFTGWSLNGGAFQTTGINPPPLSANGANWMTPFQLEINQTAGFVSGQNTLQLRVQGNGRNDGILAQGTYSATPEPATMLLLATGLAGLVIIQRRRRRA